MSWQAAHSSIGWTEAWSSSGLGAVCGWWQRLQSAPSSDRPSCWAAKPSDPSWQEAQSLSWGWTSRAGWADAWGWWQVVQSEVAGSCCTWLVSSGPSWHWRQSAGWASDSIDGWFEPCGSWHDEQVSTPGWRWASPPSGDRPSVFWSWQS